jgi:hypothetical protein
MAWAMELCGEGLPALDLSEASFREGTEVIDFFAPPRKES